MLPVDDDPGPYIIVTGNPTSIPARKKNPKASAIDVKFLAHRYRPTSNLVPENTELVWTE